MAEEKGGCATWHYFVSGGARPTLRTGRGPTKERIQTRDFKKDKPDTKPKRKKKNFTPPISNGGAGIPDRGRST